MGLLLTPEKGAAQLGWPLPSPGAVGRGRRGIHGAVFKGHVMGKC